MRSRVFKHTIRILTFGLHIGILTLVPSQPVPEFQEEAEDQAERHDHGLILSADDLIEHFDADYSLTILWSQVALAVADGAGDDASNRFRGVRVTTGPVFRLYGHPAFAFADLTWLLFLGVHLCFQILSKCLHAGI